MSDPSVADPVGPPPVSEVARTQSGGSQKNTLVRRRMIRVQILDCRSLQPVVKEPVEKLTMDGTPLVAYEGIERHWDIASHLPVVKAGNENWYLGGSWLSGKGAPVKGSQYALNALGFNTGAPAGSYGQTGRTGFLRYRLARGLIAVDLEDPAVAALLTELDLGDAETAIKLGDDRLEGPSGAQTVKGVKDSAGNSIPFENPTDDEVLSIVGEYNTDCFQAAALHLAAAGFFPGENPLEDGKIDGTDKILDGAGGNWTEGWQRSMVRWRSFVGWSRRESQPWVRSSAEGKKLAETRKRFVTDENGMLHVPLPLAKLKDGLTLEISFSDFAVAAEATREEAQGGNADAIHREASGGGFLGPSILRKGEQSGEDWGWWLKHRAAGGHREKQFSTVLRVEIPAFDWTAPDATWLKLQNETRKLSFHFDDAAKPEIVAFALIWCQPVWDEVPDAAPDPTKPVATKDAYREAGGACTLRHMHLASYVSELSGWKLYGGKWYAWYEYPYKNSAGAYLLPKYRGLGGSYPAHQGLDIHAARGAEVYALHGGTVTHATGSHKIATLRWTDPVTQVRTRTSYLHNDGYVGANNRRVRAGEIIAKAGRTGNIGVSSVWPGHVHLNVGFENALRGVPDDANKCVIPSNDETPILFPCRCDTTDANAAAMKGCEFKSTAYSSNCWAVNDLACPHMDRSIDVEKIEEAGSVVARRTVQAQLRKLGHYMPDPAENANAAVFKTAAQLKALDGDFGAYDGADKLTAISSAKIRSEANTDDDDNVIHTAAANDVLKKLSEGQGSSYKSSTLWYEVEFTVEEEGAEVTRTGWIHSLLVKAGSPLGATRLAIYEFKKAKGLATDASTLAEKYTIDAACLAALNADAPIVPLTDPVAD